MAITLLISDYGNPLVKEFIDQTKITHVYDGMESVNKAISNFVDEEEKVVFFHQKLYLKNEILEGLNITRFDERNVNAIVDTMTDDDNLVIYNLFYTEVIKNLKQEHPNLKIIYCHNNRWDISKLGLDIDGVLK